MRLMRRFLHSSAGMHAGGVALGVEPQHGYRPSHETAPVLMPARGACRQRHQAVARGRGAYAIDDQRTILASVGDGSDSVTLGRKQLHRPILGNRSLPKRNGLT